MTTISRNAWVLAAAAIVLAFLPPRCAQETWAAEAEAPPELEPITVTPLYIFPGDRQMAYFRKQLPDLASGDPRALGMLEQLSDFFATRSDPNELPVREIEWFVSE